MEGDAEPAKDVKTPIRASTHSGELSSPAEHSTPAMRSLSTGRYAVLRRKASLLVQRESSQKYADRVKRVYSAPGVSEEDDINLPKIIIGVCAMEKKAKSKPMQAICSRLKAYGEFQIKFFGDDIILNQPVEEWPDCDCLLSWFSDGFPLKKAQQYAAIRKPYLINDIFMQDILLDRRMVYRTLTDAGIPVPKHIIVDRDSVQGDADPPGFVEHEDYVELNGVRICKPMVEKPASGEDHNIYIYYPHSMGGGVKKLFRKVDNKSGEYDPTHPGNIRRDGSYIYEEFLTTGGTDVKVYTVGPRYAHAEARKSPVVDGKVKRTADGKEVRFPVLLSPQEKEIARMVCLAFGQKVCGFDFLRSDVGKSYVCDVNGWSFVKNSLKYYDDAAGIIRSIILSALAPHRLIQSPTPHGMETVYDPHCYEHNDFDGVVNQLGDDVMHNSASLDDLTESRHEWDELRCVLAVVRHGDRTPKQKMKMVVKQPELLGLMEKHLDSKGKQAKLKSPNELQDLLDVTRELLLQMEVKAGEQAPPEYEEAREKFRIVKTVLEQGGSFAGVNRKVQLKPLVWAEVDDGKGGTTRKCTEALLILKHGGVLTHAGRAQATSLGQEFRTVMYPRYGQAGGGLLRLHSTYRHDLKIYSSDEGRVQTSAAAFTQGLLDLEGASLTPILVSLVKKDVAMLDAFGKGASDDIRRDKTELYSQMTWDEEAATSRATPKLGLALKSSESGDKVPGSGDADSVTSDKILDDDKGDVTSRHGSGTFEAARSEGGSGVVIPHLPPAPLELLRNMVAQMKVLVEQLRRMCLEEKLDKGDVRGYSALLQGLEEWKPAPANQPCSGERLLLMFDRWRKLLKAVYSEKKNQFDISKVPDIYDAVKYDAIHNTQLGLPLQEVYKTAKVLADAVIPNEYGIAPASRLKIGSTICSQLLGKILADMANMREESIATAGIEQDPNMMATAEGQVGLEDLALDEKDFQRVDTSASSINGGELEEGEDPVLHRLCPAYATDINSPLRHVRTRIYYTSESHMHSLVNVLRFSHIDRDDLPEGLKNVGLLSAEAQRMLANTTELDYSTHLVFRMFENKRVPVDAPERFYVELWFSPGAAYNPFEVVPMKKDHTLPVAPRVSLHTGNGVEWKSMTKLLKPYAARMKASTYPSTYSLPNFSKGSASSLASAGGSRDVSKS